MGIKAIFCSHFSFYIVNAKAPIIILWPFLARALPASQSELYAARRHRRGRESEYFRSTGNFSLNCVRKHTALARYSHFVKRSFSLVLSSLSRTQNEREGPFSKR